MRNFKNPLLIILGIALTLTGAISSCRKSTVEIVPEKYIKPSSSDEFINAVDISEQFYIQQSNTKFYDSVGNELDLLWALRQSGVNTIRLRTWVGKGIKYSMSDMNSFAKQCKKYGFNIWLAFHYSNTWSDPGNQPIPTEWSQCKASTLADSVFNYTYATCKLINPEFIQIGNEINHGFLWPQGNMSDTQVFFNLLRSGANAATKACPLSQKIIHIAGYDGSAYFFQWLNQHGVDYDIAGISYYPYWHGKNVDTLNIVLKDIQRFSNKRTIIAETAFPFTTGWNDWTHNSFGDSNLLPKQYRATNNGQYSFCRKLVSICRNLPFTSGICYWEPTWVAYRGQTSTGCSPWENQTWFDFKQRKLPVFDMFKP